MMTSAVRSLVSKSVSENEAGKLFSLLACTETASKIFGVVTFVNIYSMTAEYFAGVSYLCEALLLVI
jgi:PCFT/HCP family folate transporter-like MFS transporter 1/3